MDDSAGTGGRRRLLLKHPLATREISWIAFSFGILLAFYKLLMLGQMSIATADSTLGFPARLGQVLFMVVLSVTSLVALGNPKRAGIWLLIWMPLVSFCAAYPEAALWVPDPHGAYPRWPGPAIALALSFVFFLPFYAALLATRHRAIGVYVFVFSVPLAALIFRASEWTSVLLPSLAAWSAPFLVLGAFWLGTSKSGWSPLVAPHSISLSKHVATVIVGLVILGTADIAATFAIAAGQSRPCFACDGSGRGLFVKPMSPDHAVFTARLIYVPHQQRISGSWQGTWAIGLVKDTFWGLHSWERVVLLTSSRFWDCETSLIDGIRYHGLLTQYLPIVGIWPMARPCDAAGTSIRLRLLRETPTANETRIIGYVRKPQSSMDDRTPPTDREPFAGTRVAVIGSSGTRVATTDREGIYQVAGLPPDNYTVKLLDLPKDEYAVERTIEKRYMLQQRLIRVDIFVGRFRQQTTG